MCLIRARFPGSSCAACHEPIHVGEVMRYTPEGVYHAEGSCDRLRPVASPLRTRGEDGGRLHRAFATVEAMAQSLPF